MMDQEFEWLALAIEMPKIYFKSKWKENEQNVLNLSWSVAMCYIWIVIVSSDVSDQDTELPTPYLIININQRLLLLNIHVVQQPTFMLNLKISVYK